MLQKLAEQEYGTPIQSTEKYFGDRKISPRKAADSTILNQRTAAEWDIKASL